MKETFTLIDIRRMLAELILKQPWIEKVEITPHREHIQIYSVGTGFLFGIEVFGLGMPMDTFTIRICEKRGAFFIIDPDKIEAEFNVRILPLLLHKYFTATAERFIRLATDALEEQGKSTRWAEGTVREGKDEVGKYLNFGGNNFLFSYPSTDEVPTFTYNLNLSHTKYEATGLSRDIGYIEAEIMNKVDQFIKRTETNSTTPVTPVSLIGEDRKNEIQTDLNAMCGDKPVCTIPVGTLIDLIEKYDD